MSDLLDRLQSQMSDGRPITEDERDFLAKMAEVRAIESVAWMLQRLAIALENIEVNIRGLPR